MQVHSTVIRECVIIFYHVLLLKAKYLAFCSSGMFAIEHIVANLMLFIIYELIFNMAHDKFRGMGRVLTTNRHLERSTPSFGLPMV